MLATQFLASATRREMPQTIHVWILDILNIRIVAPSQRLDAREEEWGKKTVENIEKECNEKQHELHDASCKWKYRKSCANAFNKYAYCITRQRLTLLYSWHFESKLYWCFDRYYLNYFHTCTIIRKWQEFQHFNSMPTDSINSHIDFFKLLCNLLTAVYYPTRNSSIWYVCSVR